MPPYIIITVLEQLSINFYTACSCLPGGIIGLLDLMIANPKDSLLALFVKESYFFCVF